MGVAPSPPVEAARPAQALRVAVYESAPFGMRQPGGGVGGLSVELWEIVARELGWTYVYELDDMAGLMSGLGEGRYDVGIGAITITPERELGVDFTHPVNDSGTGFAVSRNHDRDPLAQSWHLILFSLLQLVVGLLVLIHISGIIMFLVERRRGHGVGSDRKIISIGDGLWWAAVTMTTVGYGDVSPRSSLGRIVAVVWMFAGIVMFSLFTATTSSILTSNQVESSIRNISDLRQVQVGAAALSSGQEFCRREHLNHVAFPDVEAALEALRQQEVDAVVSNVPVLRYHHRDHELSESVRVSPHRLAANRMGFALPPLSPLREPLNRAILTHTNTPQWVSALERYLGVQD